MIDIENRYLNAMDFAHTEGWAKYSFAISFRDRWHDPLCEGQIALIELYHCNDNHAKQ